MKILSIDVGIKNLAYCILEKKPECKYPEIIEWNIINLCQEIPLCTCLVKDKQCTKKASYFINNKYYCKVHSKKSGYFLNKDIPNLSLLKKKSLLELKGIAQKNNLDYESVSKSNIVSNIYNYYCNNRLNDINVKGANDMSIIEIARALNDKLNFFNLDNIDQILIENQIATIASRMKCIESMLVQYFTMKNCNSIRLVSSSNKLKYINGVKNDYKNRKILATNIVNNFLNTVQVDKLPDFLNHKKKDDLADTFLQATWYLIDQKLMENIFLFADYLK